MKILFYYWMQYNDCNSRGGGVQVYLRNIIEGLRNENNIQIYTLSSGTVYDLSGKCHIEKLPNDGNIERYQIVNSPMLAPSKTSFFDQNIYSTDSSLKNIFLDFIHKIGGVDIIHFQSMEGLTLKCFELKKELKDTKCFLSLHNYQIFCPQVNLWKNNSVSCDDFHAGNDCITCLGKYPPSSAFRRYYLFDHYLRRIKLGRYSRPLMNKAKILSKFISWKKSDLPNLKSNLDNCRAKEFLNFRAQNIEMINRYIDRVLCVSNRVKEIALYMGIRQEILLTSYIGTRFAENQKNSSAYSFSGDVLKIAYMGYMRRDKGFFFLLDSLERLPEKISKRIAVVIAARYDDMNAVTRLKQLTNKFASIELYNGYTHNQIPQIIKGVHLGIVPVLWENNLPQVAIEFKAMGIPVLASDLGGASELSASTHFIFKNGNYRDFADKLNEIIKCPAILDDYWDRQMKLKDMGTHLYDLLQIYGSD